MTFMDMIMLRELRKGRGHQDGHKHIWIILIWSPGEEISFSGFDLVETSLDVVPNLSKPKFSTSSNGRMYYTIVFIYVEDRCPWVLMSTRNIGLTWQGQLRTGDVVPTRSRPTSDKRYSSDSSKANLGRERQFRFARGQHRRET